MLYTYSWLKNNWQLLISIKNKCEALEPEVTVTSRKDLTTHWTIWNSPLWVQRFPSTVREIRNNIRGAGSLKDHHQVQPLTLWVRTGREGKRRELAWETRSASTLNWTAQPPTQWEINFCCWRQQQFLRYFIRAAPAGSYKRLSLSVPNSESPMLIMLYNSEVLKNFLKWNWKSFSRVRLFETQWTTQSREFSRPEYWSG